MTNYVFIAFQDNEESRPLVEAIERDNPDATVEYQPGMVRIQAAGRLEVNRATIEEILGREFDLQEMHINLLTLSGNVDESDDQFVLQWDN